MGRSLVVCCWLIWVVNVVSSVVLMCLFVENFCCCVGCIWLMKLVVVLLVRNLGVLSVVMRKLWFVIMFWMCVVFRMCVSWVVVLCCVGVCMMILVSIGLNLMLILLLFLMLELKWVEVVVEGLNVLSVFVWGRKLFVGFLV